MSNNRRPAYATIAIIAVVIIATAAVILWFKPSNDVNSASIKPSVSDNETNESVTTELAAEQVVKATTPPSQSHFVTGLENLPRSLKGTQIDGEIIIDENKQLVVTEGLRRLFDYFLSALGEEEEAVIFARVESYIRHHTPEPAASQAVTIFNQYVAYLKALPEIEKRYGNLQLQATKSGELDLNAVAQQKQDIANLRQQYFDKPT
ncbi:MAG: lipase chaperone, partial [Psychrobacter nivimaris]